jgi:hypothetical protein
VIGGEYLEKRRHRLIGEVSLLDFSAVSGQTLRELPSR